MKGLQIGIEFMGKILISVFIISVIVILLTKFLPEFSDNNCQQRQFDEINDLVNDAVNKRTSSSIKQFNVFSCMEYVNFDNIVCDPPQKRSKLGFDGEQRCYEVLLVGGSGNCKDMGVSRILDQDRNVTVEDDITTPDKNEACENIEGSLATIPGGNVFLEIKCDECVSSMRYIPGSYAVEVGAFSIKFLETSN